VRPVAWSEVARRAVAIAIWVGLFLGLVPLGNRLVPNEVKAKVSLQIFLLGCQVITLVVGLGAALLLLRERRAGLGFQRIPAWSQALSTVASVPFVFVASSYVAIQIALPTLMEELRTRGAGASQQNAGEFGRALTQAPLFATIVWGAVLGALGEELFFRGLLWSTLTDLTRRILPARAAAEAPPQSLGSHAYREPSPASRQDDPPRPTLGQRALSVLFSGGIATLVSAALFGWMHNDLPGGVGIVRVVSTTCLGLASGFVRHLTGGVLACIALHAAYNTLVIGGGRKWFSSQEKPVLEGIPNALVLAAVLGLGSIGVILFVRALIERRARSTFVAE
jgi:membrane protease YdiL (CAAX protease family)